MIIKSKQQKHAKLKKLDCSCYWYFALNDIMQLALLRAAAKLFV